MLAYRNGIFIKYLNMGIEGIAYATLISKGGAFLSAVIYIRKKYDLFKISLLGLKFNKDIFLKSVTNLQLSDYSPNSF